MSGWTKKLVLDRSDPRLFAKVTSDNGEFVEIEFFRSVADREPKSLPRRDVAHAALPTQTRVFIETSAGVWRVGRVVDRYKDNSGEFSYSVKFPNDELLELHEDECFVRCLDRYADPSRILAAGCIETQFFADRRRGALRQLRELRSAAQGLVGVISAPVDLVPHQIATVRRVVSDRTVRYLLADEVGLGKTIEAGLIIRQLLLDDPQLVIRVFTPASLVKQWRAELSSKCHLDEESVTVHAHEDLRSLDTNELPGLLVVDEAHRLISQTERDRPTQAHQDLRRFALQIPKLLLLSATPALGDEARLLGLLNLLDPAAYPLDDLAAFRSRVAARQQIGRLLLAIQPGGAPFVLSQQAKRAMELFPADPVVQEECRAIVSNCDNAPVRDSAAVSLRSHIASTYRIHQRLIRARRSDVEKWTMRPRGPAWPALPHVRICFSQDAHAESLLQALEAWRDDATRASADKDSLTAVLAARWSVLIQASWRGGRELARATGSLEPIFFGETETLERLRQLALDRAESEDRYSLVSQEIGSWLAELSKDSAGRAKKLVCFASAPNDAVCLFERLSSVLGAGRVISLVGLGQETAAAVDKFENTAAISVAICDGDAEEGINLQFVHGMVHIDLPLSADRLEQRIGRLDRFGRRLNRVEHRVFFPSDEDTSPWKNWFDILANGFEIFNRSISDVQFRVEAIQQEIQARLFREGAYAVESLNQDIKARLTEERQALDEQHALDGLSQLIESGDQLVQDIERSEDDEEAIAANVEPWIRENLRLSIEAVGGSGSKSRELTWRSDTLLPEIPWRQPVDAALRGRWTWSRRHAMSSVHSPAALLRPGSALIEVLERIAVWDDRGIAYATLRMEPSWSGIWRGFRLVWLVEPTIAHDGAVYARHNKAGLLRRAEGFLPSITVEQLVDETGQEVKDPAVLKVLTRPYHQQRELNGCYDINLGSRPELMQRAIDRGHFVALVETIVSTQRDALVENAQVSERLQQAREACARDVRKTTKSLQVRSSLAITHPGLVERPLSVEIEDLQALQESVERPRIRLDEIGFLVVSGPTAR